MEIVNGERLVLGTCYYPEHWDESLWRDDLRRMLENGIEVIRIAEFAWSRLSGTKVFSTMISLTDFWMQQRKWV